MQPTWLPTRERFLDPTTERVMRVWVDPADHARDYAADYESPHRTRTERAFAWAEHLRSNTATLVDRVVVLSSIGGVERHLAAAVASHPTRRGTNADRPHQCRPLRPTS